MYKTSKISSSHPPAQPFELPTNISDLKALARDNPTPKPYWISEWCQKTLFFPLEEVGLLGKLEANKAPSIYLSLAKLCSSLEQALKQKYSVS